MLLEIIFYLQILLGTIGFVFFCTANRSRRVKPVTIQTFCSNFHEPNESGPVDSTTVAPAAAPSTHHPVPDEAQSLEYTPIDALKASLLPPQKISESAEKHRVDRIERRGRRFSFLSASYIYRQLDKAEDQTLFEVPNKMPVVDFEDVMTAATHSDPILSTA